MTLLSEMANMPEEQAQRMLDDLAAERKAGTKPAVNGRAYIQSAKIDSTKLVGTYTTNGGRKVVVTVNSTNPTATLNAGHKPTKPELKQAELAVESVPVVRMTDPTKPEDDPSAELPEEI